MASIALNLLITVAEFVGGLLSGSLALRSDAVHNLSDTVSLAVALFARRIAQRDPTARKTFGYRRAEVIGAFVNLVTLVLIAAFLIVEAVERLVEPSPIDGAIMLGVASVGLVANLATAGLLFRDAQGSLNIRSAFLHIVADAVSSVGVVIGGLLVVFYDVYLVDPILTLAIALYILYSSWGLLRQATDVLMEAVPAGLDLGAVDAAVRAVDGVADVHHLHVWGLDEHHAALEAHVVLDGGDLARMEAVKRAVKARLADDFDITHSTLEFEFEPCADAAADCYGVEDASSHAHGPA